MSAEHQSSETRSSAIMEETFPYATRSTTLTRDRWHDSMPSQLFRYRIIKRGMDILFVLMALPVLLPIFGIIAIVMVWTSPGPIFFSHRRIRKNGAFFSMWKFRTMCVNSTEVLDEYLKAHPEARAEWYANRKLRFDPRVTAVGAFLRRFSLDELPQVWNVLMGTMSLVGPRPIVAAEVEKYAESFQCYCRVKPGLTGLWQVSGRSEVTYPERVALDCDYVERWSLWRDIVILMKTFAAVLKQDGAF
jgi:Undecaprenyl-phosphate galactose phosphotransferase WbaP